MIKKYNPKIVGSGIIDCVPQIDKCPRNCSNCFYNNGFYLEWDELPQIPSVTDATNRIVRMNSGNDSNHNKKLVIETASIYKDVFFNTSYLNLNFPGPVVLTINPGEMTNVGFYEVNPIPKNLMFVRARVNLWNQDIIHQICGYYSSKKVPIVLTYMRYYEQESIPKEYQWAYLRQKHILNTYYSLPKENMWNNYVEFHTIYLNTYLCGTRWSSLCEKCGNCVREYHNTKERMWRTN